MPISKLHKRILAKTLSWRICATLITILIVYAFTKKIYVSLGVGLVEVIAKTSVYYFHEHVWGKISWNKLSHPLSDLKIKPDLKDEDKKIIKNKLKELGYIEE